MTASKPDPPTRWSVAILAAFLWLGGASPVAGQPDLVVTRGGGTVAAVPAWRMMEGDDPLWADSGYDDSGWSVAHPSTTEPAPQTLRWYRARIRIAGTASELDVLGIYLRRLAAAYEIYWDGRLLLRNGTVGATAASTRAR